MYRSGRTGRGLFTSLFDMSDGGVQNESRIFMSIDILSELEVSLF